MAAASTIYLTGCMGAGKTSVGRCLRDALGRAFVDVDAQIALECGRTSAALIDEDGEPAMREVESRVIARVGRPDGRVVALGGGSLGRAENLAHVEATGTLVYLEAAAETLAARATADTDVVRPLLRDAPVERMRALVSARASTYERAKLRVLTESRTIAEVAQTVAGALGQAPLSAEPEAQAARTRAAAALPKVQVPLGERAYDILLAHDGRALLGAAVKARLPKARRAVLVADDIVFERYGAEALGSLLAHGLDVASIVVPAGEASKCAAVLSRIYDEALAFGVDRGTPIVALGGGVVGDLAGYAAATLLRGLPFVQVPTTLLALVDSSVGGKTGINHAEGKNLIGAFHQPALVFADTSYLSTLSTRDLRAGLAEVVKYGVIADAAFFEWLESSADALLDARPEALLHAVRRSCELKAQVVAQDELETTGARAALNFGHTFGHALERLDGYGALRHGEAVAIGMCMAARVASRLGMASPHLVARIERLLARLGLPTDHAASSADLAEAMRFDKKADGDAIRFILPEELGVVRATLLPPRDVARLLRGES